MANAAVNAVGAVSSFTSKTLPFIGKGLQGIGGWVVEPLMAVGEYLVPEGFASLDSRENLENLTPDSVSAARVGRRITLIQKLATAAGLASPSDGSLPVAMFFTAGGEEYESFGGVGSLTRAALIVPRPALFPAESTFADKQAQVSFQISRELGAIASHYNLLRTVLRVLIFVSLFAFYFNPWIGSIPLVLSFLLNILAERRIQEAADQRGVEILERADFQHPLEIALNALTALEDRSNARKAEGWGPWIAEWYRDLMGRGNYEARLVALRALQPQRQPQEI